LDIPTLKKAYKKLMQKLHPDLHRNKSEEEQDDIHDQASNVTRAYRTLLEPQHRALHLLELMGKPLDENTTVCTRSIRLFLVIWLTNSKITLMHYLFLYRHHSWDKTF
jgi:DnaJ-domain-containing protein 1